MRLATLLLLIPGLALALIRVPQDVDSIQTAINLAMAGDTVLISPGTWTERLHVGNGRVTLCSNYVFSGDSADVVGTVLDGQDEGTILTVHMDDASSLELNGLTLTRGRGDYIYDVDSTRAGAVHVIHAGTLRLANLVFHHNNAPRDGAVLIFRDFAFLGQHSRISLDNLNCYSNEGAVHSSNFEDLVIAYARTIEASRLRVDRGGPYANTAYYLCADESLKVRDLRILGQTWGASAFQLVAGDMYDFIDGQLDVADIQVVGNTFLTGGGIGMSGGARGNIRARNLRLENNQFPQGGMAVYFGFCSPFYGPCHFLADSVFIRDNVCRKSLATVFSSAAGTIRNLFITGNHLGQRAHYEASYLDYMVGFTDTSVDGALFADNVMESCLGEDGAYNSGGSLLPIGSLFADSLFYRNLRFVNNTYIDHDDYRPEELENHDDGEIEPNRGRMIKGLENNGSWPRYVLLDSCEFVGNRQANIIPETGEVYWQSVIGSQVDLSTYSDSSVTYDLRHLRLQDCDDGGITLHSGRGDILVRDVEIADTRRAGLAITAGTPDVQGVLVENVFIHGIQPQDHYELTYASYCHQSALELDGWDSTPFHLDNLTIAGNFIPYLLNIHDVSPARIIRNSIVANNYYVGLANPAGQVPSFEHCLLTDPFIQPDPDAPDGNLVGLDPRFDPVLGPPWLAADSPCVDAGDPDPAFNDIEDPANPGFARWPSRGGLRNDMGFTGGLHASQLDIDWIAMPQWEPNLPTDFTLGAPWPNPFNPVTQIPFTLARPARVRLSVFNLLGQEVAVLVDGPRPAGAQQVAFQSGRLASGLYLIQLEVEGRKETRAVTLVR